MKYIIALYFLILTPFSYCNNAIDKDGFTTNIMVGAEKINEYLPLLKNKKVGLVVNQTSMVKNTHLLDTLLKLGIKITVVFAPEHGFRGTADAGEHVKNGIDPSTKTAIISLYGDNKKPKASQLKNLDILVFDIQDVGARFYTYISTMAYVMEACAENKKKLLILDRPNPNGFYVDGPILDTQFRSFVGMHKIPIVHGMTIGEYAKMLNGEKWLKNKVQCAITIIKCTNYDHSKFYKLPIKPSPNLPNMTAIYLYPSLCLFEGTKNISLGRGTDYPFQIYGSNTFTDTTIAYKFIPESKDGAKNPPLLGKTCYGYNLSKISFDSLRNQKFTINYLLNAYQLSNDKNNFLNDFFIKLIGKQSFAVQLENGMDEKTIKNTWQKELLKFKTIRKKYLLYKDFE